MRLDQIRLSPMQLGRVGYLDSDSALIELGAKSLFLDLAPFYRNKQGSNPGCSADGETWASMGGCVSIY